MLAGPSDKCPPEPPGAGPLGTLRKVKVTSVVRYVEDVIKSYHAGLCRRQTPSHKGTCLEYILAVMNVCQRLDKRSPGQRDQEAPERRRIASGANEATQERSPVDVSSPAFSPPPRVEQLRLSSAVCPSPICQRAEPREGGARKRTWVAAAAARTCRGSNQGAGLRTPRALFFVAERRRLPSGGDLKGFREGRKGEALPRWQTRGWSDNVSEPKHVPRSERNTYPNTVGAIRVRIETRITVLTKGVLKHGAICVRIETRFGDRFGSGPRISAVPKTPRFPQPFITSSLFFSSPHDQEMTLGNGLRCPALAAFPAFYPGRVLFPLPFCLCAGLLLCALRCPFGLASLDAQHSPPSRE
ncbi:hypothetical protein E2320_014909 [Naja naja]|nr:hypothetical protein E2320_014909 [Naja naja]